MKWLYRHLHKKEKGFTLVELMVVIIILAVLTGIAIPSYLALRNRARIQATRAEMQNIGTAIAIYEADMGVYPATTMAACVTALESDDSTVTVETLMEGKALTLKMLGKVMEDHGLELVDPKGEPFNPEWHQAITMLPSEEFEDNTVLEVLQKGFKLHDRLIRPAMVVVAGQP